MFLEHLSKNIKKHLSVSRKNVKQPQTASTFNQEVEQIIGKEMSAKNLECQYRDFCMDPPNPIDYPSLKANVSLLYQVMKNCKDATTKQIAHNALIYYFADEKAINDRILGFGRVDDLIVIDYATNLLKGCA